MHTCWKAYLAGAAAAPALVQRPVCARTKMRGCTGEESMHLRVRTQGLTLGSWDSSFSSWLLSRRCPLDVLPAGVCAAVHTPVGVSVLYLHVRCDMLSCMLCVLCVWRF